jgi:hypothetical protein
MPNQRDLKSDKPGNEQSPSGDATGQSKDKVHGEGNYEASRQYNEATKQFVESGKVDAAAQAAKPKDEKEAREMREAEAAGKQRAKEEDPALAPSQQREGNQSPTG